MKSFKFIGEPVRVAAWLYYSENQTQSEVARCLGISRQTVANYLAEARKHGLVEIRLLPDILSGQSLAQRVRDRFDLADVHVVPECKSEEDIRERVARAGAEALCALVADGDIIGVSSGRTMTALARYLPHAKFTNSMVIQVSGSSLYAARHSPEMCATAIATSLSAHCRNLHAPAYLSSPDLAEKLCQEPALIRHFGTVADSSIIVFGVGELTRQTVLEQPPHLDETVRDAYLERGAQSVVFGRFLDCQGRETTGPVTGRTIAISLETARSVPLRLAICGGAGKQHALVSALAANLVTHLVIDSSLATSLLEKSP